MRTVTKTITTTVLLSVLLAPLDNAEARLKYYRYNDNIPMVEMSLNMMVAMGVLEPIPSRLVHDGNPYNRLTRSRYDRYSRYYDVYPSRARYSGRSRYFDDYWDEPIRPYSSRYYRSRYGYGGDPWYLDRDGYRGSPWYTDWDSPWGSRWDSPWGSRWDSPRYSSWDSPWDSGRYSPWAYQWNNPWNSTWSNPWGSLWSYQLLNPWSSPLGYLGGWPYTSGYSIYPLTPDAVLGDPGSGSRSYQLDDSSRPVQNPNRDNSSNKKGLDKVESSRAARPSPAGYGRGHYRADRNSAYQRLNGLWVGDTGEMLGIRGDDFLWYDKGNRYAQGQLLKSPTTIQARIPETRTVVRFHYRLHGDELVILSRDGKTRIFNRMPLLQAQRAVTGPRAAHTSYHPDSEYLHVSRSSYQSSVAEPEVGYPRSHSAAIGAAGQKEWKRRVSRQHASYSNARPAVRAARINFTRDHVNTNDPVRANELATPDNRVVLSPDRPALDAAAAARAAYTGDTGSDQRPLTVKPEDAGVAPSETVTDASAEKDGALPPGADGNDPYTYLFSYLKDSGGPDTETGADISANSDAPAGQNSGRSNIWKPNDLFPDRRHNASATVSFNSRLDAAAGQAAVNGMNGFRWPREGVWE